MKTTLILASLAESPATAAEIANVLQMRRDIVSWMLIQMVNNSRYASRSVFHRRGPGPSPYMYQITGLGLRVLRQRTGRPAVHATA